ncbi:phospholipid carrier-dependent glycosyltransferase [Sphingomonas sp. AOB5]|uniref:phospholipid carrier-dependent glycosyltransferase n=1 Tax=Sphingomonas sp. AOB5 TaxID=3034017 RepID=UPI0023F7927B|nr:phospholipid carrier-dependent glycosyltransferase [Sphingomonas sp. AOB5]MDF7776660.1 phospholipid carrier-dependent glycosyltransferase [Sphingomonas sp. AOB5]
MLDRIKALADRPLLLAALIGLAALLLFGFHIGQPTIPFFDEEHYVPAARALIELEFPRNTEHPLVAKQIIAWGIELFGDDPFGWRIMSAVAGAMTVVGGFTFMLLLAGAVRPAVIAAILLMLNQTLFIQSRIAMLDIFLGVFILWAMVVFLWAMRGETTKQVLWRWIGGSVLLGLAVGVKWAAIPYVALAGLAFIVIRVRDAVHAKKPVTTALGGKGQPHWQGLATIPGLLLMGVVSIAVYLFTFAPAFFYAFEPMTLETLIPYQQAMYAAQTQVLSHHTYQSDWWSWPIMERPIWYLYEYNNGAQRGVLLIGNPMIMWGGLIAVGYCLWNWFRTRAILPLAMALLWIASLAIYIVIPKSLGFFYYYHLSGIFICFALPVAFDRYDAGRKRGYEEWFLAAALLLFVYFYPIISAMPLSDGRAFEHWMWFDSWR